MDIEIQTQHVALQPEWRTLIETHLAKLAGRYPELIRVHLTVKHDPHHQHGHAEVDIVAGVPGRSLRAAKEREDVLAALHASLDALERELATYHEVRRGA